MAAAHPAGPADAAASPLAAAAQRTPSPRGDGWADAPHSADRSPMPRPISPRLACVLAHERLDSAGPYTSIVQIGVDGQNGCLAQCGDASTDAAIALVASSFVDMRRRGFVTSEEVATASRPTTLVVGPPS